jgi:hypothetical protein
VLTTILAVFAIAVHAEAQSPWTVTLTPTLNPLPIGFCAAIQLRVLDATGRDAPRNSAGARVTISDFDITISGTGVVANRIDASHWESCACQGAPVGSMATVTANYPAQSLAENARVPGVTVQETATFALGPPKGTLNPRACAEPRSTAVMSPSTPTVLPPLALPETATRAPAVPAAPAGPPPSGIQAGGTPAEMSVMWYPPLGQPQPTSYSVERWKLSDPACCRAVSPTLPAGSDRWHDPLVWPGTWRYQVTAIYADGRRGSAYVDYVYVEPEMPTGLKAAQTAKNTVVLTWQPAQYASYYVVSGPPTNTAVRVDGTTLTRTGVPVGDTEWKVSTMYEGKNLPSTQGSAFATATLKVVNTHYRLVAEAIRVTSETVDKPLSEDGKFDEIFMASIAERYDRGTSTPPTVEAVRMSHIHGDISFWSPSERVKAGTASGNGGLKAGDIVSPVWGPPSAAQPAGSPMFVLWDGELIPGKHDLILHPSIWEVDQAASELSRHIGLSCIYALCSWAQWVTTGPGKSWGRNTRAQPALASPQVAVVDRDQSAGRMAHLERHDRDRPIGLVTNVTGPTSEGLTGDWEEKLVVLSSEKLEAALASGTNRIEVRFWDRRVLPNTPPSAVDYLNGDYTLVIRIERMP